VLRRRLVLLRRLSWHDWRRRSARRWVWRVGVAA
jgi:hypothetical protein